jgi:hypothetical protein
MAVEKDLETVIREDVMLGCYIPSLGRFTPMTKKDTLLFVDSFSYFGDKWWHKYGTLQGYVAFHNERGYIVQIGEIIGTTYIIPLKKWDKGFLSEEVNHPIANALKGG